MTSITNVIGRKRVITSADDGKFLLLSDSGELAGVWVFEFVPDNEEPFEGTLSVMGRIQGQQAFEDEVAFTPIPYRASVLNGVTGTHTLKTDPITSHSLLIIPATGLAVAVLVGCTSGTGTLYSYARQGDAAIGPDGPDRVQPAGADVVTVSSTFTRPANTTAYTAGDVVSNSASKTEPMAFPGISVAGRSATLVNAVLTTDKSAFAAQMTAHCFTSPNVTVAADNAAATTLWVNSPYYVGALAFPTMAGGAGTNTMVAALLPNPGLTFTPIANSTTLYVVLVDNTGATPASGQQFRLDLTAVRN